MTLPTVTLERLQRGDRVFYWAHIVGPDYDHHGEADTPQDALWNAVVHWRKHIDARRTIK